MAEHDLVVGGRSGELLREPSELLWVVVENVGVEDEEVGLSIAKKVAEAVVAGGHDHDVAVLGVVDDRVDVAAVVVVAEHRVDGTDGFVGPVEALLERRVIGGFDAVFVEQVAEVHREVRLSGAGFRDHRGGDTHLGGSARTGVADQKQS